MNLYIKQRIFTWGDKFSIYDEFGNERYYVEGEVFTFGKKLHLYDVAGNELAYIEQKIFTFLPKYFIHMPGRETVEVVKEFTEEKLFWFEPLIVYDDGFIVKNADDVRYEYKFG